MTKIVPKTARIKNISTHILTKRMTVVITSVCAVNRNFNSHPHEEDDRGNDTGRNGLFISTHILTKRMTCLIDLPVLLIEYFNSHPHEEDDPSIVSKATAISISTHILTKRMTVNTGV